ncbi:hypothetical protein GW819_00815 [Candidatus Gracilibacteria bacterium]|nr:hypothetical protein [bacterium]NDK19362.1 hypothetical protein [Candidatus Gracilibacteria bacterium]OIO77442.1 MAG: hypothetical protein AUJ87_01250 [Candidatus Gracilibacteria bacterium CG1_02_38_174]PIQ10860.1 MAG: hypothetical protein COW68_03650 [Candidatus Gracilibacteria bacterium CG18_big_fil_WC_8_21_14_2_50_38_16]PIQ41197.1 MAG: hypothetical protein COW06_03760 [Candidatus Gracilibacteria bacterium CG12_big_fil_rev_8_21_14_0_65_38_15]PIZ01530.1 MAG: hypothetical protein COY60_0306
MSQFKSYLQAGILTELFEKAFLSGKFSKTLAITAFIFIGVFWVGKIIFKGIFFIFSAPWNTQADETYRSLKKVANDAVVSGKTINSIEKNMDWMEGKWHSLNFRNTNGRGQISEVLFLVHAKLGYMRIFIYSESGETLELLWEHLHKFTGIPENCDLKIENLSEIYHKMYLNLL